ncbi:MAG TPA: AarF/ABC1/UbiB kinase family protein [Persephonella sp.]|uniref:Putative ubiquinone biosynthesis protein AarF n=1 Tax=Persephonella marina (strain DSM 14350 / EX-H1) TaxID=123214 RepID=C0QRW7_PERMH|nr:MULTISPECIES: AarF/UbiB family protein [Persephonella]ACO04424.1 putative ubiquinone biosynthesis protein AarF [Persephonella marina EX-H1]HCB69158.1 AarF/ABC1/UbiB kinase family protein [Persephonella sp.]
MFRKNIRLLKRFKEISTTLSKLGFYNVYEYFQLLFGLEIDETKRPKRLREALEKLGPSFIKLGQVLSTRPDLVPQEVIKELIKLQDKVAPIEFETIEKILIRNYGEDLDRIFSYIDPEPLASASISQVHTGYLQTGEKVAIKIRRPGLKELINLDSELMLILVRFLERHSKTVKELNLPALIHQFKRTTLREANLLIEAQNIQIFRKNFENYPQFYVPKCYTSLTHEEILVTEFIEGIKISETEELVKRGFSLKKLSEELTDAYFKMVFVDGIYHADPHPGNIFVMDDGRICAVDYGMISRLPKEKKRLFYDYIIAVTTLDVNLAMHFYEGLNMITPKTDIMELEQDVETFLEKYYNKQLDEIDLKEMVLEVIDIVRNNHLRLPMEISYLGKTAINLEGTVRSLYPEFNPTKRLRKFITLSTKDYIKEKLLELKTATELYYYGIFKLENIYRLLIRERLTFSIIFKDLEELQEFYRFQTQKIAVAIVFIGLLISSGIFFLAGKTALGDIILVFAILFGLFSLYKIFRF